MEGYQANFPVSVMYSNMATVAVCVLCTVYAKTCIYIMPIFALNYLLSVYNDGDSFILFAQADFSRNSAD